MTNCLPTGTNLQGGKYRIVKTLGQGGFGITYEAKQPLLRRNVAIKEFFMKDCCEREEMTNRVTIGTGNQRTLVEKFRGKFIREAQMIAAMDHPNIVRVTDVFEENDTAYYVMENLPGGSLAEKVKKEGPLSEELAKKYIRQVAGALDYIHSLNTVHLDVKPSNILLNAKGEAVLIDFGVSKHYDDSGEQTSSTPVGISKGFAPLEQGRDGDVSQFKPSTDIYALGATLYYLLTGSVPPEATIVNEDGLSRAEGISDRMWNTIHSAMLPRRKDRPQSVADFLNLLGDTSGTVKKELARKKGNEETMEETILASVRPMATDRRISKTPAPTAKDGPIAKPPVPKEAVLTTFPLKPSRRGLWVALAIGVTLLALFFLLFRSNTGSSKGHEWVDLGLSVKWATCNVGASSPSDYGLYFAWGETSSKTDYSLGTYKWLANGSLGNLTKYNNNPSMGAIDNKSSLDKSDDAARSIWGGSWRLPTKAEFEELRTKCTWKWIIRDGKSGYLVTGKNGKSIFLPAAGFMENSSLESAGAGGAYWSSTLYTEDPNLGDDIGFTISNFVSGADPRYVGFSIRPITK